MTTGDEVFSSGTVPTRADTRRTLLIKEILATIAAGASGLSGAGSPEGVETARPGATYVDTSTGDLWAKQTGTGNTGWTLISSVAGTLGVFGGNGSPVGVVIPTTAAALYVQFDSDPPYIVWVWDGSWH